MQHHLRVELFKDGVYDSRNAIQTFSREKADVWSRSKSWQSLHEIGRP
jgi:hypothetical protein